MTAFSDQLAQVRAWRRAHDVGGMFLAKLETEAPASAAAVRGYREAVEQFMAEAGFPVNGGFGMTAS